MHDKIERFVSILLQIFHVNFKYEKVITQFVLFGLIGITNTAISYILNILVLLLLKPYNIYWDFVLGNIIAFLLSVLWSFYWNNRIVFQSKNLSKKDMLMRLIKTYVSYGITGIVLNNLLSYIWINVLDVSKYIAPLINLLISVPLNFIINKYWAFEDK